MNLALDVAAGAPEEWVVPAVVSAPPEARPGQIQTKETTQGAHPRKQNTRTHRVERSRTCSLNKHVPWKHWAPGLSQSLHLQQPSNGKNSNSSG